MFFEEGKPWTQERENRMFLWLGLPRCLFPISILLPSASRYSESWPKTSLFTFHIFFTHLMFVRARQNVQPMWQDDQLPANNYTSRIRKKHRNAKKVFPQVSPTLLWIEQCMTIMYKFNVLVCCIDWLNSARDSAFRLSWDNCEKWKLTGSNLSQGKTVTKTGKIYHRLNW